MAYTGKKPTDHTDVTQSQSMTVTDDLTVDTDTLYVDSTNDRVGVGNISPAKELDVTGAIRASTGMLFGSDTAAANTLDDYEEGTWTPVHGGNNMIQTSPCRYTKIGRAVFLVIDATSASGSSATHTISGLPFTSTNSFGAFHIAFVTGNEGIVGGYVSPSSNTIILIEGGTNNVDTLNANQRIIGTGMYFTA